MISVTIQSCSELGDRELRAFAARKMKFMTRQAYRAARAQGYREEIEVIDEVPYTVLIRVVSPGVLASRESLVTFPKLRKEVKRMFRKNGLALRIGDDYLIAGFENGG